MLKDIANPDVDCFKDGNSYCVIDLNYRIRAQYPFGQLAGAELPTAILNTLSGETIYSELLAVMSGKTSLKDINP